MILFGAGEHAKVLLDVIIANRKQVTGVIDHNTALKDFHGIEVSHTYSPNLAPEQKLIIAIGNNGIRHSIARMVKHSFGILVDQSAFVAGSSSLGTGSTVLANAIVQSNSVIGNHCIINSGAIVEHDCKIGDAAHIAPGAVLCGQVSIGQRALVGANATILPGISVGVDATIGAGSVVTRPVHDGERVVGNPANCI